MAHKVFRLVSEKLFPMPFPVLALVLIVGGAALISSFPLVSIVMLLGSILIFTAHAGFEIDREKKEYREFNSFMGIRKSKVHTFQTVNRLLINSDRVTQRYGRQLFKNKKELAYREYNIYLELQGGQRIYVATRKNKGELLHLAKALAAYLNVQVSDHSANS